MWSTVSGTHKLQQGQKILNFWSTIFMFDRRWAVRNVNPVAFFADFPVHRPPVDDRPVISSFTVDYRDDSLTV
ncbi:hypothetical protein AYI70_g3092 [Smittium culicis]|uniref:Uncharacterized protein n=1 Tax=Smittium culicis TaxID=133412 RepID=A0A1R1Y523_9FUNG|nr:hypothetical protein AYI70_g3092 [Smittium culicis]